MIRILQMKTTAGEKRDKSRRFIADGRKAQAFAAIRWVGAAAARGNVQPFLGASNSSWAMVISRSRRTGLRT